MISVHPILMMDDLSYYSACRARSYEALHGDHIPCIEAPYYSSGLPAPLSKDAVMR